MNPLGAFELLWRSLEGDVGGVLGQLGVVGGTLGYFMRCLVVLGYFGVLWRFDVCIGLFRSVRVALGVFGRRCWGRFGGVLWDVWVCWGHFGGVRGIFGRVGRGTLSSHYRVCGYE